MKLNGKKVILSSASPRRRELLAGCGIEFTVDTANSFIEHRNDGTCPEEIPVKMAEGKSDGFHRPLEDNEILITSDTMVYCDGKTMGKPSCREEAVSMLKELSGKSHYVITAVCIRSNSRRVSFSDKAYVHFKELEDSEIDYYVDFFKPYDKAGAYGIQEWIGYIGISGIDGSFFTIMGLPTHLVYNALKGFIE